MILRLGANAAVHAVGGAVMGVTVVLAACTLAQTAQAAARQARHLRDKADDRPGSAVAGDPFAPPPPSSPPPPGSGI